MTLVTFSQVVARYVFNSGAVWALELTVYLFAWLVLFGMSYGVKVHAHIGVDAFAKLFPQPVQRILALAAVAAGPDLRRDPSGRLVAICRQADTRSGSSRRTCRSRNGCRW